MTTKVNMIKNSYENGACPDCGEDIPDDTSSVENGSNVVIDGDSCRNCGHVFYASKAQTEEVCDECGSTNIGYDALVKKIGGELEVVAGPFDRCTCLNDYCASLGNETGVRSVPVQSLRYCDGKDCYYNGDKDVMTSKVPCPNIMNPMIKKEPYKYWYCSRCTKETNSPEENN